MMNLLKLLLMETKLNTEFHISFCDYTGNNLELKADNF